MELVLKIPLMKLPNTKQAAVLAVTKQFGAFFLFLFHERHPTIVHLAVHLENGQRVYFKAHRMYYNELFNYRQQP